MTAEQPPATPEEPAAPEETVYSGIGVAPGIAIGPTYAFAPASYEAEVEPRTVPPDGVDAELERLEAAVRRAERELRKIGVMAGEKLGSESAAIFEAQGLMLRDAEVLGVIKRLIREDHVVADFAVHLVMDRQRRRLEASTNAYIRERAPDLADVRDRLLRNLRQDKAFSGIAPEHVVVAETLTAADVLLFSRRDVLGIAIDFGGPTSHVSIMARALGVPAVVSLHGFSGRIAGDEPAIIDGFSGRVILHPTAATLERYRARAARYAHALQSSRELAPMPAETLCGHHVALRANVELQEELARLHEYGAEGIGLFRTEMLLLSKGRPLDEHEQYEVYRGAVEAAAPHPVTFRLIDLGGDKLLPMAHREHNPTLGWRGVRILLDRPELLRPQLRALLRAAVNGSVRILAPMVSSLSEIRRLREEVEAVKAELEAEGTPHGDRVPLGMMVEVPAAALLAPRFAEEVEFFSIGTNDLTQFTLAVDRGNDLVSARYHELDPAVLCLIERVTSAAAEAGLTVSVCGEMAGNPRVTPILVGLGVTELSASPAFLLDVKRVLRAMTLKEAHALAELALSLPDAEAVEALTVDWLAEHTPELAALLSDATNP